MVKTSLVLAASLLAGSQLASTAAAGPAVHRAVRLHRRSATGANGYCKPRRSTVNQGNDTAVLPTPAQQQQGSTATVQLAPIETFPMHSAPHSQDSQSPQPESSSSASSARPSDSSQEASKSEGGATTEFVDITSFVTLTPSSTVAPVSSSVATSSPAPSSEKAPQTSSSSPEPASSSASSASSASASHSSGDSSATSLSSTSYTSSNNTSTDQPTSISSTFGNSASSDAASSSHVSPNSTAAPSSIVGPSSAVSSTVATSTTKPSPTPSHGCPAGTSFQTFTDDFSMFDHTKWTLEAGDAKLSKFGPDGLTMHLDESNQFIVYQSTARWAPPTKMSVGIQSTSAPGIVSAMTFLAEAGVTDEIDLELIEGSWQVPMWNAGHRLEFGRDVVGDLPQSTSRNLTSWVYDDKKVVPFDKVHQWDVDWKEDSLSWSADGRKLLDVQKMKEGKFVTQTLPVRFGPWVAGSWAGVVDWKKNPKPKMIISNIKIEGCRAD